MFAPKIAKPQTKPASHSRSSLPPPRSTLMAQRHDPAEQTLLFKRAIGDQATLRLLASRTLSLARNGSSCDHEQEALAEYTTARKAPSGISWDFSKSPLFPGDRTNWSQPSLLPTVKPLLGAIHAKLVVGSVDDPLEREADRIADHVMRMPDPNLSVTSVLPRISCKYAACRQKETQTLHAKSTGPLGGSRGNPLDPVRQVLRSPGQPLDPTTLAFFEPRFGRDFSKVRVHTDPGAAASAKAVNAQAYTIGSDLVFGAGRYTPRTDTGRQLLAHELAHFLQQRDTAPVLRRFGDPSQAPAVLSCPIADAIFPATDFLLFPNNVSELTPGQKSRLNAFAASWHAQGGGVAVRIDGFASEPGDQAYNWQLSCARALAVQTELLTPSDAATIGIPQGFLQVFMHGETSEFGDEAQNRRVTLFLPSVKPSEPPTPEQPEDQSPAKGVRRNPFITRHETSYGTSLWERP